MNIPKHWLGEGFLFLVLVAGGVVLLPLGLAALAHQSRQAMFWPAAEALYTYFFAYTLLGAVLVALLITTIRTALRFLRRRRPPDSA